MTFLITNIYREGNHYANSIAATCFHISNMLWMDSIWSSVTEDFFRNMLGLPEYRFTWSCLGFF